MSDIGVKRDGMPALLDILDGRVEDLKAGNYPAINRESIGRFIQGAL